MLVWARRVETQRAQEVVLNTLTESRQFDKVKMSKKTKDDIPKASQSWTVQQQLCRYCRGIYQLRQCQAYGKMCVECEKVGHFRKVSHSRRSKVVNEMEQEVSQENREDEIETVSINSVYMNKN